MATVLDSEYSSGSGFTASKLSLYNGALRLLKERKLASLTENREPRRWLDDAWDGGAVDLCLEAGQWKFAMRSVMLDASPSIAPDFGYEYGFEHPDDFIRAAGVFSDESMLSPLNDYRDEAGHWFASLETIYIRYVSNNEDYGMDYSLWPQTFVKFVEAHLASEVAGPLTEQGKDMLKIRKQLLSDALSKDAMADPTKFLPVGSWVRARGGGRSSEDGQPR